MRWITIRFRYLSIIGIMILTMALLVGCTDTDNTIDKQIVEIVNQEQNEPALEKATVEEEIDNKSPIIQQLNRVQVRALENEKVPVPQIMTEDKRIASVQDSYCWGGGCADYIGGPEMLKGHPIPQIEASTSVYIFYPYTPQPDKVYISRYETLPQSTDSEVEPNSYQEYQVVPVEKTKQAYRIRSESINIHHFPAPAEPGIYYYGIGAQWMTEDGKYSNGDTLSAIAFEVIEKKENVSSR